MIEKPPVIRSLTKSVISILNNPVYRLAIEEINSRYLYWDKVKYKVPNGLNEDDFWTAVKFLRQGKSLVFAKRVFTFTETNSMQRMLYEFDLNSGRTLLPSCTIPEKGRDYFVLSSVAEEAIASSKMEGAVTTREIAKEMIRTQAKPKDKSQRMILNNYETIEYLRKNRNTVLSKDFILEIHKRITQGTLDNREDEGECRCLDTASQSIRIHDIYRGIHNNDRIPPFLLHTVPLQAVPVSHAVPCRNDSHADAFIFHSNSYCL